MAVTLNASTASGLIATSDTSGIIQLQSNGSTKATISSSGFSYPGGVLQVVQTIKTDTFSTTSGTLTDLTGLSVNITPTSASNKVLIDFTIGQMGVSSIAVVGFALLRGSTVIGAGATAGSRTLTSVGGVFPTDRGSSLSYTFLDSPATTSSTTYKVQVYINSGLTVYVNRSNSDVDQSIYCRTASTITVSEIAA
jgi:hypothetical protein